MYVFYIYKKVDNISSIKNRIELLINSLEKGDNNMSENLNDPFSVCFGMLKMKYRDYDESLTSKDFLSPNDKINVFINLESAFKNLSMIMDLEQKIIMYRDFDTFMVSYIVNLAAHYYRFFRNNKLDTRIYMYNTDFSSDEFNQFKYNEDYRAYYLSKFNKNPKFVLLTDHLKETILPQVKIICEFIPNIHYISAFNIEGSLVPYIIAMNDPSRKNLIIGNEIYDTQYTQIPNFVNHYIHRGRGISTICSTVPEYIKDILKTKDEETDEISKFINNYATYCSLISIMGDKSRSIDNIIGYGPKTLIKDIREGILNQMIAESTSNPEIIADIFHDDEMKEEFVNNYYCTSIIPMYDELTDGEKSSIIDQQINRSDVNSLQNLNSSKFYNYPLLLEALLC